MFFVLVIFNYDFSASSSWVSFGSYVPCEFLSVIPPATPPDLSVLLDLLGLLRSAALLFSGSSVPIHKRYFLCGILLPFLCVCYYCELLKTDTPRVWSYYNCCLVLWTRRTLKPAGYFCLPILSLPFGCLGRPQEIIPVGNSPLQVLFIPPGKFLWF